MSIYQGCQELRSSLNKTIELINEAQDKAAQLSDRSLEEMSNCIADILEICIEGQNSLQSSIHRIECVEALLCRQKVIDKVEEGIAVGSMLIAAAPVLLDGFNKVVAPISPENSYPSMIKDMSDENEEKLGIKSQNNSDYFDMADEIQIPMPENKKKNKKRKR